MYNPSDFKVRALSPDLSGDVCTDIAYDSTCQSTICSETGCRNFRLRFQPRSVDLYFYTGLLKSSGYLPRYSMARSQILLFAPLSRSLNIHWSRGCGYPSATRQARPLTLQIPSRQSQNSVHGCFRFSSRALQSCREVFSRVARRRRSVGGLSLRCRLFRLTVPQYATLPDFLQAL